MSTEKLTTKAVATELNAELSGDGSTIATDVTHDSRQAREGTLFVAIKGATMDGHRFVDDVMRRGAAGIISESDSPSDFAGAWLKVRDAREALAKAAAVINGNPSHDLDLVGITGTNGKTTTTYLIFALAEAAGQKTGNAHNCRIPHRRKKRACRTYNARGVRHQPVPPRSPRRFLHNGRDGNFVAGHRPPSLRLAAVQGGGVYKSDPRSSRLSRDDGKLLRRQEKAL